MDMHTWSAVFADSDARVIRESMIGPWSVSTIWLGIDRQRIRGGPPLIFETLVFEGERPVRLGGHELMWRFTYEREARIAHRHIAQFVRAYLMTRSALQSATSTANQEEGNDEWLDPRKKQSS